MNHRIAGISYTRVIQGCSILTLLVAASLALVNSDLEVEASTGPTPTWQASITQPPPGPSRTPTATSVANVYAPVVIDIVSTPTVWLTPTVPPPPGTDTPTPPPGSTATFTPTATATIPPDATPTVYISPTLPTP